MFEDARRPQGDGVFFGVVNGFVVVCPRGTARGSRDAVGQDFAGGEVFELQRVFAPAHGINTECEQIIIGANGLTTDGIVIEALCHLIDVEHHLFFRLEGPQLSAINSILLAFFVAAVVVVTIVQERHTLVVLFDAPHDFVEQVLLKGFGAIHHLFRVVIFPVEVIHNLGGLFIGFSCLLLFVTQTHPEIIVFQLKAVNRGDMGLFFSCWRSWKLSFSQFGLVVRCHGRVRGIAGATGYCERESDCKERARYDEGKTEHELIEW